MGDRHDPTRASEWLVALEERPHDAGLKARFQRWHDARPENARAWSEISRTAALIGEARTVYTPRDTANPTVSSARSAPAKRRRRFDRRRLAAGLGGAAMAACIALALPSMLGWSGSDYETATGELQRVLLADGSVVRLAPETAIAVDYQTSGRKVRLLDGIAFFDVRRERDRPFTVAANGVETRVVGTHFEVRLDERSIGVAVREGEVSVAAGGDVSDRRNRLTAGQWLRASPDGEVSRGDMPAEQIAAWLDGILIAKDRPVAHVVDELRRYYPGIILLQGEGLAEQPLSGVYGLTDPGAALHAIAAAQNARIVDLSPVAIIISEL